MCSVAPPIVTRCARRRNILASTDLTGGEDPEDDTAYPLLARTTDDGPGKLLVIRDIIFEGDLATTQKWLGPASRLISLANYDRVELIDVEGRWASETGFHLAYCDEVRAHRISLNHIAARGLDGSNCSDVAVIRAGVMPPERSQQTRTVKGGQVAAASTIGAGAIGAIQETTVGQAHEALVGVVPYLDAAKWGLLAVTLIGIGVMLWARIDDRRMGLR
jgi:hypothetical protein